MTDDEIASLYLLSDLAFNFFPQCARTERKVSPLRGGRWVFTFTDEDVADEAICFTDVLRELALFKPGFLKTMVHGKFRIRPGITDDEIASLYLLSALVFNFFQQFAMDGT